MWHVACNPSPSHAIDRYAADSRTNLREYQYTSSSSSSDRTAPIEGKGQEVRSTVGATIAARQAGGIFPTSQAVLSAAFCYI